MGPRELYELAYRIVGVAVFLLLGNLPLVLIVKLGAFRGRRTLYGFVVFYWIALGLIFKWIYPSLFAG